MFIQQRSFLLPAPIIIYTTNPNLLRIKYFTDCVFNPQIFDIKYKIYPNNNNNNNNNNQQKQQIVKYKIELDFNFLQQVTKEHPKILDNIGMINFIFEDLKDNGNKNLVENQQKIQQKFNNDKMIDQQHNKKQQKNIHIERLAVLVTNQNNDDIFVSLIQ